MAVFSRSADRVVKRPALRVVGDSDGDLLCRIAERDLDAFEALYKRYARAVFGIALRRLGDRGRAEDAVQEAFTAVWRSASTYRPERGPGAPWLFAVARNAITDGARTSARTRAELVEALPDAVSSGPAPDQSAEDGWVSFCIHAAVCELPERERVPLELAYWKGHSQSEIAHLLGLPLGTVKTRSRRGLERLAALLEGTI
jgi:RNA polymerase sigma-70 factor, ECF subfamily